MATMQNIIKDALAKALTAQADGKTVIAAVSEGGAKVRLQGEFNLEELSHLVAKASGVDDLVAIPFLDLSKPFTGFPSKA